MKYSDVKRQRVGVRVVNQVFIEAYRGGAAHGNVENEEKRGGGANPSVAPAESSPVEGGSEEDLEEAYQPPDDETLSAVICEVDRMYCNEVYSPELRRYPPASLRDAVSKFNNEPGQDAVDLGHLNFLLGQFEKVRLRKLERYAGYYSKNKGHLSTEEKEAVDDFKKARDDLRRSQCLYVLDEFWENRAAKSSTLDRERVIEKRGKVASSWDNYIALFDQPDFGALVFAQKADGSIFVGAYSEVRASRKLQLLGGSAAGAGRMDLDNLLISASCRMEVDDAQGIVYIMVMAVYNSNVLSVL